MASASSSSPTASSARPCSSQVTARLWRMAPCNAASDVPKFRSPFYKVHIYSCNNADLVAAVAPYITKTRCERWRASRRAARRPS